MHMCACACGMVRTLKSVCLCLRVCVEGCVRLSLCGSMRMFVRTYVCERVCALESVTVAFIKHVLLLLPLIVQPRGTVNLCHEVNATMNCLTKMCCLFMPQTNTIKVL